MGKSYCCVSFLSCIYFQVIATSCEMFRGGIKNGRYWYKLDFVKFDIKLCLMIILLRFWQISRILVVNNTVVLM